MTALDAERPTLGVLDEETRALVRLAAVVTTGSEVDVRKQMSGIAGVVRAAWVEELVLQSYLFAGFPRALNAMREWRRSSGIRAPAADDGEHREASADLRARGEATCAEVYGVFYDGLRRNIRELHPALDEWMIVDGYGKVLGRPGLDLVRRELCIVAACAAAGQARQLHSHLHGARNVGASDEMITQALDALEDLVTAESLSASRLLWARVMGK